MRGTKGEDPWDGSWLGGLRPRLRSSHADDGGYRPHSFYDTYDTSAVAEPGGFEFPWSRATKLYTDKYVSAAVVLSGVCVVRGIALICRNY